MRRFVLCLFLTLACVPAAWAIEEGQYSTETFTREFILSNVPDFVKTPEGGVNWNLFGATKEVEFDEKDKDGMDIMGYRPVFIEPLKKLDGQTVRMQGYMFPLDQNDKQTHFLFGPFPMTCPFHYHVGPSLVIEAFAKDPIAFTYDPVTVTGVLELVPMDVEKGMFYRLRGVALSR